MNAIEFEASIENGVVHIPKEYQELYKTQKAKFIVIYDNSVKQENITQDKLNEFHRLIKKSNNQIMLTDKLAIDTDEMIKDGLL